MPFLSSTTRVMVCSGAGVVRVFDVRTGLMGLRSREIASLGDPSDERACDEARARIAGAGRAGSTVVVLPAEAVHLRPMAMKSRLFADAKAEIERSLESLLPIDPDGASLGFVDRLEQGNADAEDERAGAGYLIGVDRVDVRRWSEVCSRVSGRLPDRMVAPHQAAMCAGFQRMERVVVRERGVLGDVQDSILHRGRILELRADASGSARADLVLPGASDGTDADDFERLAIGAALLDSCAPAEGVPVGGEWTPLWKRAVPIAVLAVVCVGLVFGAMSMRDSRYEVAVEDVIAQQQALRAQIAEATKRIAERDRLAMMIRSVATGAIERDAGVIEIIASVERALPEDVFLEQFTVNADGVRLRGVAASARDVLAAIESSRAFDGVRESQRPQPVGDGSAREVFDVRAQYIGAGSGRQEDSP